MHPQVCIGVQLERGASLSAGNHRLFLHFRLLSECTRFPLQEYNIYFQAPKYLHRLVSGVVHTTSTRLCGVLEFAVDISSYLLSCVFLAYRLSCRVIIVIAAGCSGRCEEGEKQCGDR